MTSTGATNLNRAVIPASALIGLLVLLGGMWNFGTEYVAHELGAKATYFQAIADEHQRRITRLEEKDAELERVLNQLTTDMAVVKQVTEQIREILSQR